MRGLSTWKSWMNQNAKKPQQSRTITASNWYAVGQPSTFSATFRTGTEVFRKLQGMESIMVIGRVQTS
jgi:hypothetical protein